MRIYRTGEPVPVLMLTPDPGTEERLVAFALRRGWTVRLEPGAARNRVAWAYLTPPNRMEEGSCTQ